MKIKAFYLNMIGKDFESIVLSENAGRAKYRYLLSAHEAGYKYFKFRDIVCRRSKEHDVLIAPMPCSRNWPINKPITYESASFLHLNGCDCFQCQMGAK